MVRPPSFDTNGMKKGAWSEDEDNKLRAYIMRYGHWNWGLLPKYAGKSSASIIEFVDSPSIVHDQIVHVHLIMYLQTSFRFSGS